MPPSPLRNPGRVRRAPEREQPALRDERLGDDADAFYEVLSKLVRHYQFRDRDRTCCGGLSVTEWYALDAVMRSVSPSIGDLGRELQMNKSTATRVVGALEALGLLARHPDPTNRKVWKVGATPQGRALHASIVESLKEEHRSQLSELSHPERLRVTQLLQRLTEISVRRLSSPE